MGRMGPRTEQSACQRTFLLLMLTAVVIFGVHFESDCNAFKFASFCRFYELGVSCIFLLSNCTTRQTKRFLRVAFHCFPLSVDKITWSLTIFFNLVFYQMATPGSNYTRNWGYFKRTADLNREKLGKKRPGQYRPSEEDLKAGFKEKISFFKTFFKKKW